MKKDGAKIVKNYLKGENENFEEFDCVKLNVM